MFSFLDDVVRQCSERIQELGGSVIRLQKSPPATSEQVARVAKRFGGEVPPELLQLGMFANEYDFVWSLNTAELGGIHYPSGRLGWTFRGLCPLDPRDFWWAQDIVSGSAPGKWHRKVIINCEGDGDFLAYTIDPELLHVPVYCPVDGCEPIELILGTSLADFFQAWARIGFLSINKFYAWTKRTGLRAFDINYFRDFERLLKIDPPPHSEPGAAGQPLGLTTFLP